METTNPNKFQVSVTTFSTIEGHEVDQDEIYNLLKFNDLTVFGGTEGSLIIVNHKTGESKIYKWSDMIPQWESISKLDCMTVMRMININFNSRLHSRRPTYPSICYVQYTPYTSEQPLWCC